MIQDISKDFITAEKNPICDEIQTFKTTNDYISLAKAGIIPCPLLANDEQFPSDFKNILKSFDVTIEQKGRYSFLSKG